jgi:energy-coupling factor transport system permease protein
MRMSEIMQYINRDTFLHRLSPLTKLIAMGFIVLLSVVSTDLLLLAMLVAVIFSVAACCRLHAELVRQMPLLVMLSGFLILLTVVTFQAGETIGYLVPAGVFTAEGLVPVTAGALDFGAVLSLRFFAMLFAFQLLVISTRPSDFMKALLALRMPVDYVLMFLIALRFIPSLQAEGRRIYEAQLSRGYNPGDGIKGKIMSLKPLMVPLVANSLAKTHVLGLTMDLRGYRTPRKVSFAMLSLSSRDILVTAVAGLAGITCLLGSLL